MGKQPGAGDKSKEKEVLDKEELDQDGGGSDDESGDADEGGDEGKGKPDPKAKDDTKDEPSDSQLEDAFFRKFQKLSANDKRTIERIVAGFDDKDQSPAD